MADHDRVSAAEIIFDAELEKVSGQLAALVARNGTGGARPMAA